MDENQSLTLESTTSQAESAVDTEDKGPATAPQEQEPEVQAEAEGGTSTDTVPTPYMTIQYNHEDKTLTEEEAVIMAQKGYAYDDLYKKLHRAAALQGKDVKELIESFEKAQDENHRAELVAKYGEDTEAIEDLMEVYRNKKETTVKAAEKELERQKEERQTSLDTRLANEFIELQKEFPDVKDFASLPKSVKSQAAEGRNLYDAYLRYLHTEKKKIDAANASAEAAKKASAGNLSSADKSLQGDDISALMQGLYG